MPVWSFVRHGESQANAEGWFAGRIDTPLTRAGEQQAIAARGQLEQVPIDRIICSDLQRARRTAELLAEGSAHRVELVRPELRERSCGDWEQRPIADIETNGDMLVFGTWTGRPPGGESLRDVAKRAIGFLAQVEDERHTLVVAHGALIRAVIGVVDGVATDRIGEWKPGNCELVSRELAVGTWSALLVRLPN